MSDPIWYRSLYFRIAFGFVALLATLLAVQGVVFLWMTGRMPDLFPSRSAAELAAAIATDTGALLADPSVTDLAGEINREYSGSFRGFVVALSDGRLITSTRVPTPPDLARNAQMRAFGRRLEDRREARTFELGRDGAAPRSFERNDGIGPGGSDRRPELRVPVPPQFGSPLPGEPGREPGQRFGTGRGRGVGIRGGGRGGFGGATEYATILSNGVFAGVVAVPMEPPPLFLTLRSIGPTLGIVALVLLAAGTAIGALVIVGPTRRRLQDLRVAARALGDGDLSVRAPETGGDEVTALSHTFNEMASQLESRTEALELADRTRRQLLADVSHELMTPLSSIRGYVETLEMTDVPIDERTRRRYLGIVNEEAVRLEAIIGDLLDLAKLEGGGGNVRVETVSPEQLLTRVRDRHAPIVAERGIVLETDLEPGLAEIRGDGNRLEQALQNLVANAIRHTPDGGRVAVHVASDDDGVVISVEDSGPGIPAEHLPRIFDRFYKVDESRTGTAMPSGSGLGLSIVQAIVARHGGAVTAANVEGRGARFEIRLPGALGQTLI